MIKINNLFTVIFVLIVSSLLGYASFSGSSPEAYLFPKIITSVMISLSGLLFLTYFLFIVLLLGHLFFLFYLIFLVLCIRFVLQLVY